MSGFRYYESYTLSKFTNLEGKSTILEYKEPVRD